MNEQDARISYRQLEILQLSGEGFSNKEIAKILDLEITTVKTHLYVAQKTMRAKNKCHMVAMILRDETWRRNAKPSVLLTKEARQNSTKPSPRG